MTSRNNLPLTAGYTRAHTLIMARKHPDADVVINAERAVARELLDASILAHDDIVRARCYPQHSHMTPFAATEAFAKALHTAMAWFSIQIGAKQPQVGKYDPLFATPVMFKDVWTTRQVADELGIEYGFYAQHAVMHWDGLGNKRTPRPTQLHAPDIVAHVLEQWARHLVAADMPNIAHAA